MINPQLEKVFFSYIMNNKKYFDLVKPYFFRNSEIQFVYSVIREYMIKNIESKIPSPRQIFDMLSLEDKDGIITKEILKSILKVDLKEYDEKNFIEPKFNAWVLSNRIKTGTVDIIDETRNLDSITDFEKTVETANKIKNIIEEMSSTNFIQDDDMGSDFDDAETHVQDSSMYKIKCGFETIDHMLGGGWDISTLNVIMAETSNGKCTFSDTNITLRDKKNNKIFIDNISSIFTKVSKGGYNI